MTVVRQLFDLLGIDWEIDQSTQSMVSVESALADDGLLVESQKAVEKAQDILRWQETERRDLELTVGTSQAKAKDLEGKLYGGTVRNPKELESMHLELSLLRDQQKQEEENLLNALEVVDDTERDITSLEDTLKQTLTTWQREHDRLLKERVQLQKEMVALSERRLNLSSGVSQDYLRLYDSLRVGRQGQAVAKVERGICQGCRISLPTRVVQQVRNSEKPVQCPSCNRILYLN